MMYRRALLRSTAIAPVAALGACANATGSNFNQLLAIAMADVSAIVTGLTSVLKQLAASSLGISSSLLATISGYVTGAQTVASSLQSATSAATAQPLLSQLESYLNATVSALASIPLIPQPISGILQAASLVLPVAEATLGIVVASLPSSNAVTAARTTLATAS